MDIATALKTAEILALKKNRKKLINAAVAIVLVLMLVVVLIFVSVITVVSGMLGISTGFRSGAPSSIAKNEIPSELIPIFLAAQEKYDVSWAVLAAICKVETGFGQNVEVSSAGAIGFMQFMPSTWEYYKQDGDGDGIYDPDNPWDAIFSAGNMLKANGFDSDPSKAIYRYNHAWWYVNKVLTIASSYSGSMLPTGNGLWPVPGYTNKSSDFGWREHPITKTRLFHEGIDIPAPTGTPVIAAASGHVTMARTNGGYGLCVEVTNESCMMVYAHLSGLGVHEGDDVEVGQVIGFVGSTGNSTGPHLHFGVYVNGVATNPDEWLEIIQAGS
ncbi:peptidoglycan DD-metalloendopeptidase family protein [Desulfolucanica intricata]|uniref:peptidoglycan DD-metalloendopeptidase family protein n=1 Tax=Desulfolucanica intricata TaxID=1285191 RepID=UPI000835AD64|nr:peptidoglycan DD-metalloendopeptidase family protein [Desulfolucanica intricata]